MQSSKSTPAPAASKTAASKAEKAQANVWLKRVCAPARRQVALAAFLQVGGHLTYGGFAVAFAFAVAAMLDGAPALPYLGAAALSGLVRAAFAALAERVGTKAGAIAVQEARKNALEGYADLGALARGAHGPGDVVSTLVDRCQNVYGYAARWSPGVVAALVAPLLLLVIVFTQSVAGGLLLAVGAPLLPVFLWLTGTETAARARAQQDSLTLLSDIFNDRLKAVGAIKVHNAIDREAAHISESADMLRRKTMTVLRAAFLSTSVLEFFSTVSIALVAVYVGFQLLGEFPFPTGEFVTLREGLIILMIAPEFYAPIRRLGALHHDRSNAMAAALALAGETTAAAAQEATSPQRQNAPAIAFHNVLITRGDDGVTVGPLSFEAPAGEITVIAGPSGCGKTSALLSLLGLVDLADGEIIIDGEALQCGERAAARISYIGQTSWLAAASIAENIVLAAPGASDAEIAAAEKSAGAPPLQRMLGRGGSGVSGGERQRIALARALLLDANLMLLDEPTAHLDAASEAEFLATLRRAAEGRTVIIATHHESVRAIADHLVMLRQEV